MLLILAQGHETESESKRLADALFVMANAGSCDLCAVIPQLNIGSADSAVAFLQEMAVAMLTESGFVYTHSNGNMHDLLLCERLSWEAVTMASAAGGRGNPPALIRIVPPASILRFTSYMDAQGLLDLLQAYRDLGLDGGGGAAAAGAPALTLHMA